MSASYVLLTSLALAIPTAALLTYRLLWRRRYAGPRVRGEHRCVRGRVVGPGDAGATVLAARRGCVLAEAWFDIERDVDAAAAAAADRPTRQTVHVGGGYVVARLSTLCVGDRVTLHAVDLPLLADNHYRALPLRWGLSALHVARGAWPRLRWLDPLLWLLFAATLYSAGRAGYELHKRGGCPAGTWQRGSRAELAIWCVRANSKVQHGPYRWWHSSGRLAEQGQYVAGHPVGHRVMYTAHGSLRELRFFDGRGRKRWSVRFTFEGAQEHSSWDESGLQHGDWTLQNARGQLEKLAQYVHGELHGKSVSFDHEGRITDLSYWRRNQEHGLSRDWFRGVLVERTQYRRGKRHGLSTKWYFNGLIKEHGHYRDDERDGQWVFWFLDGGPRARGRYERGLMEGSWSFWQPGGGFSRRARYAGGRRVKTIESVSGARR